MLEVVKNLQQKKRGRPKKTDSDLHMRYPELQEEGVDETTEKNYTYAVVKELEKEQPRRDVLLQLMKSLFPSRRSYIILLTADSVDHTLFKFPALKIPFLICSIRTCACRMFVIA